MRIIVAFLILSISIAALIFGKSYLTSDSELERKPRNNFIGKLDDEPKNLFWFLQISDIHISKFKEKSRTEDFRKFTSEVVDCVKPKVVIASGDLTDAKDRLLGSQQYLEEWKSYYNALNDNRIFEKTKWLDIRGNHDNFNVQFLGDSSDLFMNFSAQGKFHRKSYMHQEIDDDVKYNFVAIDASIEPGTKRPYNFIGIFTKEELDRIDKMLVNSPGDFIIWFAHYPTSTIRTTSGSDDIRTFIGKYDKSSIFVAGHLHTMGGLVKRMYTLHPEGFLELELGDFMRNRLYRVAAYDNGIFSFVDVKFGTWPIILITNPKDILFNNPFKEDIELQQDSTHIRILGFSTSKIVECKVLVNGASFECLQSQKNPNFFACKWSPSLYRHGKHEIIVKMKDENGNENEVTQTFALDGSKNQFGMLARMVLMNDLNTVFMCCFLMAFCFNLTILMFFKGWEILLKRGKLNKPFITRNFLRNTIEKYLIFASVDKIYFGVVFALFYQLIGPWSFHPVLDNHIGVYFVWGIFINGEFVNGTLNWWYGFHQLMFFQLPLMMIIAGVIHRRYKNYIRRIKDSSAIEQENVSMKIYKNLSFLALMLAEIILAIFYIIQNGFLYALIAPCRIWFIFYSLFLFYYAHKKISDEEFKQLSAHVALNVKEATN